MLLSSWVDESHHLYRWNQVCTISCVGGMILLTMTRALAAQASSHDRGTRCAAILMRSLIARIFRRLPAPVDMLCLAGSRPKDQKWMTKLSKGRPRIVHLSWLDVRSRNILLAPSMKGRRRSYTFRSGSWYRTRRSSKHLQAMCAKQSPMVVKHHTSIDRSMLVGRKLLLQLCSMVTMIK